MRLPEGTVLRERPVCAAALHCLRLGAPELTPTEEGEVRAEVHPPVQPLGQIVVSVQRAEYAGACPVVLLVRDVRQGVDPLAVRGGLEDDVAGAVDRRPGWVVPEGLAV